MSETMVGYTAGQDPAPFYESVCSGQTGHTEAVQACYPIQVIACIVQTLMGCQAAWGVCGSWLTCCLLTCVVIPCTSCMAHGNLLACSGIHGNTCTALAQVYYNPSECSYEQLLDCFFANVDPTTKNRQGMDMGTQYRSGIYYHNDAQQQAAQKVLARHRCYA